MPQITLITLYGALWPIALALLPICVLVAVPRSSSPSPSSSGDDPDARLCDVFVSWVPSSDAPDAPDPADTSGWRSRVESALSHARDLGELISWLTEAANAITRDLAVEILSPEDFDPRTESTRPASLATSLAPDALAPDALAPLATWLDGLAWATLGEHAALLAEVEHLSLAGVATA